MSGAMLLLVHGFLGTRSGFFCGDLTYEKLRKTYQKHGDLVEFQKGFDLRKMVI
jgi:hypothetical protein